MLGCGSGRRSPPLVEGEAQQRGVAQRRRVQLRLLGRLDDVLERGTRSMGVMGSQNRSFKAKKTCKKMQTPTRPIGSLAPA